MQPASGGSEDTFPALCLGSPTGTTGSEVTAFPGPRAAKRSLEPVRARRAPVSQISCPGGPRSAQTFASAARARPLQVKPPSARAAARVSLEAPPRGRGTGEAAGFKWGLSGR